MGPAFRNLCRSAKMGQRHETTQLQNVIKTAREPKKILKQPCLAESYLSCQQETLE
jgi:hypothetical protein